MSRALGLIETKGLVAAIEAADAMVKAANVTFVGKEITIPALITVKVIGEVAAVKSAVDAGAEAAKRVGDLIATHVIPQPDKQLAEILPELAPGKAPDKSRQKTHEENSESSSSKRDISSKSTEKSTEKASPKSTAIEKPADVKKIEKKKPSPKKTPKLKLDETKSEEEISAGTSTIERLRREALGIETERKSRAEKLGKITIDVEEKLHGQDLATLNVHQLRRLARSIDSFPIQGREISRANRNELLDHFKKLK